MPELLFESLSVDNLHDFLEYFDNTAFIGSNEDWGECYCQFYLNDPATNDLETKSDNRQLACERVNAGQMQGYLAYSDNKVIGWTLAGESKLFPGLPDADEKLARILCFVISPQHRGEGIATALLNFAIADFTVRGFAVVEAAPYKEVSSFERNYRGTVSMFSKAGFELVAELDANMVLMRLELDER